MWSENVHTFPMLNKLTTSMEEALQDDKEAATRILNFLREIKLIY